MKVRKKPIVVDAIQWWPDSKFAENMTGTDTAGVEYTRCNGRRIKTLEGFVNVHPGDWIITGVIGEKYPCRNDVFEATYDKLEE